MAAATAGRLDETSYFSVSVLDGPKLISKQLLAVPLQKTLGELCETVCPPDSGVQAYAASNQHDN